MKALATIACTRARHNRPARAPAVLLPARRCVLTRPLAPLMLLLAGCATAQPRSTEVPVWQLARAEPAELQFLGRARISHDRPLPTHLTQQLCSEFVLVMITDQPGWADVRSLLHLHTAPAVLDFSRGAVVGMLASVGESATQTWPIRLRSARVQSGEGWIEADFAAGLYHPVLAPAYIELVYVPGLRAIRRVEIGPRAFVIRARTGAN